MPAMTLPVRFSFFTPGMLNPSPVAERAQGIWTQPLQAAACCGVSGASEAPKSTVLAVIWAMPVPEPTAEYLTGMPSVTSQVAIQLFISGATSVEPAPVRPAAEAPATVTEAMAPTDASTAISSTRNLLRSNADSFPGWIDGASLSGKDHESVSIP